MRNPRRLPADLTPTVPAIVVRIAAAVSGAIARSLAIVPVALPSVLVRLVMADDATGARSQQPVVTGDVTGYPSNDRALQAALCRGRRRTRHKAGNCHGKCRRNQ